MNASQCKFESHETLPAIGIGIDHLQSHPKRTRMLWQCQQQTHESSNA